MNGPRASQTVLLLHAPKQSYQVSQDHATPQIDNGSELLVRTQVIGLNPIDWKAPSHQVIVISTDYRDLRKAAFQEYVVASDFNVVKLPPTVTPHTGASLGVAFVAAALSLGVCMGLSFQNIADGPDLLKLVRTLGRNLLSEDIQSECFDTLDITERAGPGDWIAIWGVNQAKHGMRLAKDSTLRPDLLVDSHDQARAVDIIQGSLGGKLRFGLDTQGRDSAEALGRSMKAREAMIGSIPTPPGHSRHDDTSSRVSGTAQHPSRRAALYTTKCL
ncbi:hypothetical protein EKO27_g9251 [Xylaria grammica]|uniref:Enoyl reductase (ER) domain-containing protein n=1 Tax=Xylaria grammica TaxID=363999 RepID=A0A439CUJ7_9PEZI|nr:hypothetical protein EKO27_g9251 [Xylaria grammica]